MRNPALYQALVSFPLAETGGEPLTFLQRLCRENRWTPHQGQSAIDEYKKFLYLATVSSDPVTPSDAVDQVWHLHLAYTHSYWEELPRILGRTLHHGPTHGGPDEDRKFELWYERTKSLYAAEFSAPPPTDLWPPSQERFRPSQRFLRLDASRYWLIPAARVRRWAPWLAAFALLVFALAQLSAHRALISILILGFVGVLLGSTLQNKRHRAAASRSDSSGCAIFADGSHCDPGADCGGSGCGSGGCGGGGCGGGGCGS